MSLTRGVEAKGWPASCILEAVGLSELQVEPAFSLQLGWVPSSAQPDCGESCVPGSS